MIRAACHCTAVRFEIETAPVWAVDCNCTLCRRYGAIWAYYKPGEVKIVQGADDTVAYTWGDKALAFHHCKICGCLTHHTVVGSAPLHIRGVNARMMPTLDPTTVRLQQTDNSHTGFFWTKLTDKFQPGGQPMMPPPGPADWR